MEIENKINDVLEGFESISLSEIDSISLTKRIDTKFVFHISRLPQILKDIQDHYKILKIKDMSNQCYSTTYYDTNDKTLYFHHHQGRANRFKVRIRHYHNSDDRFFEIKYKKDLKQTRKKRIKITKKFNKGICIKGMMKKKGFEIDGKLDNNLSNYFTRITLANLEGIERATIDFNLSFEKDGKKISLPYLTIVEIKTERKFTNSKLYKKLKKDRIYPMRISKYVLGSILFDNNLKSNRFKEKMLILKKIENEYMAS